MVTESTGQGFMDGLAKSGTVCLHGVLRKDGQGSNSKLPPPESVLLLIAKYWAMKCSSSMKSESMCHCGTHLDQYTDRPLAWMAPSGDIGKPDLGGKKRRKRRIM